MPVRELPLGVDFGSERVRVARVMRTASGETRLCAVATADLAGVAPADADHQPGVVAALVAELSRETGSRQRRCVTAVDQRSAAVTCVNLPRMPAYEVRRAARFEAGRSAPPQIRDVANVVRVYRANDRGQYTVGIVRADVLRERTACLRRAGLRPIAVDYDAFALRRAFSKCDAVIDAGSRTTRLHAYTPFGVASWSIPVGGWEITRAIADDLAIDFSEAERRKRSIGMAGAGDGAIQELITGLREVVVRARERATVRRIVLAGNASRLPGLSAALENGLGASVEIGVSALLFGGSYPSDVARAGSPDWSLAVALACWGQPS